MSPQRAAAASSVAGMPSPLEEVRNPFLDRAGVRVLLKRDDLIDLEVPGNKYRKLLHNLAAAHDQGQATLLTFGGAFSNHVRATAAAGARLGFATIGVIRGEEHLPLNPVLAFAAEHGMRLVYMDRATYREKTAPGVLNDLHDRFGDFYMLPEGGSNALAVRGCAELPAELDIDYDIITCAVGTGGTLAGIAAGLPTNATALGFAVLKGGDFLRDDVRRLQAGAGCVTDNWTIETGYHFGGYAKRTPELDEFIEQFRSQHGITLDWVYEAKMMFGLYQMIESGRFEPGTVIVSVIAA